MTRQRTMTALLAAIAVLLAANLIVNLPPQEAKAQSPAAPPFGSDDDVVLVGITSFNAHFSGLTRIHRLWSDGVVEMRIADFTGTDLAPQHWHPSAEWVAIE